jgi:hypothetical protein
LEISSSIHRKNKNKNQKGASAAGPNQGFSIKYFTS